jgi:hypothetical protein
MHVRICRDCGEEFRPEIARCADCGGELADQHEPEAAHLPEPIPPSRPDSPVVALSARAQELVPFADALVAKGLALQIVPRASSDEERPLGFELRVRAEDRSRALETLAPLRRVGVTVLDDGEDVAASEGDALSGCPACGAARKPGHAECTECGLRLDLDRGPDDNDD